MNIMITKIGEGYVIEIDETYQQVFTGIREVQQYIGRMLTSGIEHNNDVQIVIKAETTGRDKSQAVPIYPMNGV